MWNLKLKKLKSNMSKITETVEIIAIRQSMSGLKLKKV